MTAVVGELTNFADALTRATSKVGGILSGGVGGAGTGQMAGGVASTLGASSLAGPIGAIAGAAVGMILGGITGAKNAALSSELSMLNSQYTSIMDAFHSNTDNLNEAIIQMQDLIAEAQVDEANSKKGEARLPP